MEPNYHLIDPSIIEQWTDYHRVILGVQIGQLCCAYVTASSSSSPQSYSLLGIPVTPYPWQLPLVHVTLLALHWNFFQPDDLSPMAYCVLLQKKGV